MRHVCQTAPRIEQIQDEISGIIDHFEACQNAHLTFVYQLGDLPVTLWKAVQYSALMAVQPMPLIDSVGHSSRFHPDILPR